MPGLIRWPMLLGLLLVTAEAGAEQMQQLGRWQVHYVVIPTTTLRPGVATRYGLKRARNLALVNISVLDPERVVPGAVRAAVTGTATNLLGQVIRLEFREVVEEQAIYYLATLHYTDRDIFSFALAIKTEDTPPQTLEFRQTLYTEPP